MKSKLLIATEWLWNCRNRNIYITPLVLTTYNNQDPSAPKLSLVEAQGVFKFLSEKDLIYPVKQNGKTVYIMNEVKDRDWEDTISELKKPKWKQSKNIKNIGLILLWFISLIITAFLGALFKEAGEDFYQTHIKSRKIEPNNLKDYNKRMQDSNPPKDSVKNSHK